MTLSISPAIVLTNKTAAASGTTDLDECVSIDGSALVALGLYVQFVYNAEATAGAVVQVYSSPDDYRWSPGPVQEVDVPHTTGVTSTGIAFSVLPGHKYYRVRVKNLDVAQSITAVYVFAEPQVLS